MAELTYIQLYHSYLDAIEPLGDAERGRLFTALLTYGRLGEVPELSGNERFIFPMMRAQMDRDRKKYKAGSQHPNWKGGITHRNTAERNSGEYARWRKAVFARDKYTCQVCGMNGRLNAHHIKKFSEHKDLRLDIGNGVTLCEKCHKKIHKGEVTWQEKE